VTDDGIMISTGLGLGEGLLTAYHLVTSVTQQLRDLAFSYQPSLRRLVQW